ncbi:coiled-coil domain-containing protein 132 [Striga asiatica]|uniref:Coiled-coil domain-containing protein 132 n=1 Tax=Striga asiatica TaxID=4170 RepID=A0A5A7Q3J9_STRAF|nr:coiled-coil domain-containing protein 132 [Striga asiatica]
MQPGDNPPTLPFPLSPLLLLSAAGGGVSDFREGGFELSRYLFLGSLLFSREGGGMDLSKVGEKIFSSVRSARSLAVFDDHVCDSGASVSDFGNGGVCDEYVKFTFLWLLQKVPARAAAAAAVARVLAGLPPHQRHNLSSSSEELSSIYGSKPQGQTVDELEREFYEEDFDPVRYILEQIPSEENEAAYFEEKAALRLAQLDKISERLSHHVMEHHEEMVKGMNLVRELEKDLKIANVICMMYRKNGRRHLTSSRNEVSRDLVVTENSKRKQALLDIFPILTELSHAVDMQVSLETCVDEGNFSKAFQVLPEYLQILDRLSDLSAVQDLNRGVEVWLGRTLQKLDSLVLEVCRDFKEDGYLTVSSKSAFTHDELYFRKPHIALNLPIAAYVVDAYALIGDVSGLAEKIQSFFMQEVLSESHSELRIILQEDVENPNLHINRYVFIYRDGASKPPNPSDLPISKHACLFACACVGPNGFRPPSPIGFGLELTKVATRLAFLMSGSPLGTALLLLVPVMTLLIEPHLGWANGLVYKPSGLHLPSPIGLVSTCHDKQHADLPRVPYDSGREVSSTSLPEDGSGPASTDRKSPSSSATVPSKGFPSISDTTETDRSKFTDHPTDEGRDDGSEASSSGSPWFLLRKDAVTFVSHALQRGRRNLWQLTTSRVSVLLSSPAVYSSSIHQFLRNYEDLSIFILAGEAFCGAEAIEFRQKLKSICEGYFSAFHRQNIYALKMVMEKETWQILPLDTIQVVSFPGLVGDGAALIVSSDKAPSARSVHDNRSVGTVLNGSKKGGFSYWQGNGNLFRSKLSGSSEDYSDFFHPNGLATQEAQNNDRRTQQTRTSSRSGDEQHINGAISEDENEDLHADFIDEDSQLPSRIFKPSHSKHNSLRGNDGDLTAQTGSSLSLLRLMDKYARLMQKLEIINVEFFKGICQLFGIFFHFVFESFCEHNAQPSGKGLHDSIPYKLKAALSRITQDCDQWIKPQPTSVSSSSPTSSGAPFSHVDVTPTSPASHVNHTSFSLKVVLNDDDTLSRFHRSKSHLQSRFLQNNGAVVDDFYAHLVDAVPDLTQLIHRTTAKLLLHINGLSEMVMVVFSSQSMCTRRVEQECPQRYCDGRVGTTRQTSDDQKLKLTSVGTDWSTQTLTPTIDESGRRQNENQIKLKNTGNKLSECRSHGRSLEKILACHATSRVGACDGRKRSSALLVAYTRGFWRYVDRIANAKWEVKELGLEHNGYVDLLLGEFKHYKTRLAHGDIQKEVQDLLLEYGIETVAETLIEGLSRVKRCTDEGRALMSLDLQVLINGLKHFVSIDVRPKLQIVETFIKAYYLPETEYVHWSRAHPEYSKNQIVGLINLVATMKGWKRKTRLEVLEKIG